jgi:hypothetical protein
MQQEAFCPLNSYPNSSQNNTGPFFDCVHCCVVIGCDSFQQRSGSVVTGFRAYGAVLAIGIFQAGVAPMFWGELLRPRLFVVKPYSPSTRVCPVLISEIFEPRTRSVGICLVVVGGTVLAGVTAGFGP